MFSVLYTFTQRRARAASKKGFVLNPLRAPYCGTLRHCRSAFPAGPETWLPGEAYVQLGYTQADVSMTPKGHQNRV